MRTFQILIPIFASLMTAGCVGDMVGVTSDGPDVVAAAPIGADTESIAADGDGAAPVVEITSPSRGSFIEGSLLTVQGHVADEDVSEVLVDGNRVPLGDDGAFSFSREVSPGAYHVRVSATDAGGHTGYAMTSALVGSFRPIEEDVPRAAVLQLGPEALHEIGSGIAPLISAERLEGAVLSYGHLMSGVWGWLDATGYDHRAVGVSIEPSSGTLTVTVGVDDIRVPLRADLRIGPDITGVATADRAVATVSARLSTTGGRPTVTVTHTDVTIDGLLVDIDGLAAWVDRNVVTNLVRGRIGSELDALVAAQVPPALEAALRRIPDTQVARVADTSLLVRGEVRSLVATRSGVRAMLDLAVEPIGGDPTLADVPGFLTLAPGYPDITATDDVRAQINLDLINAALHAAWAAHGLDAELVAPIIDDSEPLDAGTLAYLVPGTRAMAPTDAPITIAVSAILPPVLQSADDDAALLEARVPDVRVEFFADVDGVLMSLFELAVGVVAPIEVSIWDDEITIDATGWSIVAEVIGDDVGLPQGAELDGFLSALLAPALEDFVLLESLGIPQLHGFDATDLFVDLDDGYLVAEARLTHSP